jgi:hypothetical protein
METFDGPCRWDPDGRDEELGAVSDGYLDELVEVAVCVVVVGFAR